ncbi:hypothetical protein [Accumulibacter sp.]|uniref:chorismate transformation enzyme, FkbO/Hyg5 family n=1 Tax=Accumulibacter sp. TaxID=2053492 RepID=UPI0028C50C6E|nr:hypothetical protein [Accumulibacter sp.]
MNAQPAFPTTVDLVPGANTGRIVFGADTLAGDGVALAVPAALLAGPAGGVAVARLSPAAAVVESDGFRCLADGELLFGVSSIDETGTGDGLGVTTELAYRRLFTTMAALGYPVLVRVWNYLAGINRQEEGVERYRRFNRGRQRAFAAAGQALTGRVPAACALGVPAGPLRIAFLASRRPMLPLENPRQISAYHYPDDYGAYSPTFSRAALLQAGACENLFISGTAAIVGHRSCYTGDVVAQAEETVANLLAVIAGANLLLDRAAFAARQLDYVVYLRHAGDLPPVRALLLARLGVSPERLVFVAADVCRAELLIEIEAGGRVEARGRA